MSRANLLAEVKSRLGARRLVWAGIRGEDVESISDLPQLSASYSIIGAYRRRSTIEGVALEDKMGRRVDLETWDIDDFRHEEPVVEFRRSLLRALNQPSALLPYRPSRFLSAIWFARRDRCIHLGLFGAHQFAFEHKPWVETSVGDLGVPTIPWIYVADEEQLRTTDLLSQGSVVLRLSRTSGGQGIVRVTSLDELENHWPQSDEAFVSVAPYLENVLPINVGGTVWNDGVTVHFPSVQLIGIPGCVTRPFGYCGNDFCVTREFEPQIIDEIEKHTTTIGRWLRSKGYIGTFGVDYLLDSGGVLRFTEINPRFQGSTVASGRLAVECGQPCLPLEHLAAVLGCSSPKMPPLRMRIRDTGKLAQLVVHWTGESATMVDPKPLQRVAISNDGSADVLTRSSLLTDRGAAVARLTVRTSLTSTGFDLREPYASAIKDWTQTFSASQENR